MDRTQRWQEYLGQAVRFAQLSRLASDHANLEKQNPKLSSDAAKNYDTFETVAIAVCHGFAIEMLIKGIREKHNLTPVKGHNLLKLMNRDDFEGVRKSIEERFKAEYNGYGCQKEFLDLVIEAANLFEDYRYHFEGKLLPAVNADFTSFLYRSLKQKIEITI